MERHSLESRVHPTAAAIARSGNKSMEFGVPILELLIRPLGFEIAGTGGRSMLTLRVPPVPQTCFRVIESDASLTVSTDPENILGVQMKKLRSSKCQSKHLQVQHLVARVVALLDQIHKRR